MNRTLLVKKPLGSCKREYPFVPNIGMDIKSSSPIKAETNKLLRLHIIPGKRQGNQKRLVLQREK